MSTTETTEIDPLDEDVPPAGFSLSTTFVGQRVNDEHFGPATVVEFSAYDVALSVDRHDGAVTRTSGFGLTLLAEEGAPVTEADAAEAQS